LKYSGYSPKEDNKESYLSARITLSGNSVFVSGLDFPSYRACATAPLCAISQWSPMTNQAVCHREGILYTTPRRIHDRMDDERPRVRMQGNGCERDYNKMETPSACPIFRFPGIYLRCFAYIGTLEDAEI